MLLFLNDISGSEILLVLVFILIFFGSKSIPGLARTLGRTIRQIKDASNEIQSEIKKSGMDIKKDLNLTGLINETAQDIQRPLDQYAADIDAAVRYEPIRKVAVPPAESTAPVELPESNENEDLPADDSVNGK
jgi:TatA/E family protein of Tat protein translocase